MDRPSQVEPHVDLPSAISVCLHRGHQATALLFTRPNRYFTLKYRDVETSSFETAIKLCFIQLYSYFPPTTQHCNLQFTQV